jgi:predicted dehydrogenase
LFTPSQTNAFVSLSEAIDFAGKHRLSPPRTESNDIPDYGIDGLIIATPTFTHAAIIKESASLGISIFTEKPVDETADKIRQLFDICYKANVALCCGFQRRFDHTYVSTAKAVHDGHIGTPLTASIFFAGAFQV